MLEPLLLTTTRITTHAGAQSLTAATGFFFERDARLYLVTSRHVLLDAASGHRPDRIEITLHTSASGLAQVAVQSLLLYEGGLASWRQAEDGGGEIDVALLEIQRDRLPAGVVLHAFTPAHLPDVDAVEVGAPALLVGFPLGFYDTVYHLPVARQACVASAFGVRFQGQGYFLTDARAHRGVSGAPVAMRDDGAPGPLRWRLLGVHSSRMDMGSRDVQQDESLGLNCAWYADVLMALTGPGTPA